MTTIRDSQFNYNMHHKNDDWTGRTIENFYETVQYQQNSFVRIWFNEQNQGFAAHWHNALEIIMPLENYYDVDACNQSYHIQPEEILMLLMQMNDEYFGSSEFRELSIHSYLTKLLVIVGRELANGTALFSHTRIYKQKEYIQKFENVISYIDNHYIENLSLDAMASYSGFSKYHFSRLFKQYTNFTYHEYLIFRRIKAAEELLNHPSLSVTEIALQSGFSSISSFNRIFKQKKGCTPSEYRAAYTIH